jgi:hypothetical protein
MPVPRESRGAAKALIDTADEALTRLRRLWLDAPPDYPLRLKEGQECLVRLRERLEDEERHG